MKESRGMRQKEPCLCDLGDWERKLPQAGHLPSQSLSALLCNMGLPQRDICIIVHGKQEVDATKYPYTDERLNKM